MKQYILISDKKTLEEYNTYYFKKYPKRRKAPIKTPLHPSVNTWFILPRPAMNKLKQDWKEYIVWLVTKYGYQDLNLEKCEITYKFYMPTRRRADTDNMTPKFVMDGLTEAHMIVDDDYFHCNPLTIYIGYDKDNSRMEIIIETKDVK